MAKEQLEVPDTNDLANENPDAELPGWGFDIPGECLKVKDPQWSEKQRRDGISVRCVFLSSTDEEQVLDELARAGGSGGRAQLIQARRSLVSIDGKKIPYLEKASVWESLGPMGRGLCVVALQRALAPSEKAGKQFNDSFRVFG